LLNAHQPQSDGSRKYDIPVFPMGDAVPKLIHQCFFGARIFTDELAANVEKIKSMNPDWRHTLYDENMMKQFIVDSYGARVLSYYDRIDPKYGAARTDLFRYLLLYKVGGIYLDIKSTVTRPFTDFITPDDRYLLGQWDDPDNLDRAGWGMHKELADIPSGEFQQWHIICAAGHPFLRAVILAVLSNIDRYLPWRDGTGAHGTFRLTGPVAYTLAINPLRSKYPSRLIHSSESGLEYSILSKRSHATLFTSHYYRLTDSIVQLGPVLSLIAGARYTARQTNEFLRSRIKAVIRKS
jgi:hypothetical protein